MAIIFMVRHGRAAGSYSDDLDPGLDELGQTQATQACDQLLVSLPLSILSSPLRRARETAEPLALSLGAEISIEKRVSEIPSPGLSLQERGPWLQTVMQGKWQDQTKELQRWQQSMRDCLLELKEDTAIFTHFVAINAMVAAATNNSSVLVFKPDNGSITQFDTGAGELRLLNRGKDAVTHVN